LARYYNARYLALDVSQRPSHEAQTMIDHLIENPGQGFQLAYRTPVYWANVEGNRTPLVTEVYRFPQNYGGLAEQH
jgi:hypothetical protein